ncbi:PREDICTED: ankyrin repeat and SOCS box protein 18 [Ceratotherium simum simum]|uniref:Ankyrin repeat and SOCS box protein 18 n=1 Tax=Ceratotherium simum simum TaxID=73337 RepID=A0ABM1CN68_CERSS|nr:PREDICTED: ankyrin repeat and SOCS box protein 18 [Ceratotherium simum simum]
MSNSDCLPDYPLNSDLVRRLKSALAASDEERVRDLLCTEVGQVDAVIELANDDWMKDPSAQLPPGVLLGDLDRLEALMDQFFQDANVVFEIKKDEMEWQVKSSATFGPSGLWTLEYKRELTTPLCIAAARGHTACVSHLIARGAHPDASPGGRGALHEACLGGHTACVQLLLRHRADPDLLSAEGLAPLHLCRTAASLGPRGPCLAHGPNGSSASPLHADTQTRDPASATATALAVHQSPAMATALAPPGYPALPSATDPGPRPALGPYPDPHHQTQTPDPRPGTRTPGPHLGTRPGPVLGSWKSCSSASSPALSLQSVCPRGVQCAQALLEHGASVHGASGAGGDTPLHTAACAPQAAPQRTVQALLNHGSPTVWPDAFPKVLKTCAPVPAVIEVLFNSYPQLRVSESWKEVIPEEVFQMHQPFYKSFFALAHTPRCLQHLCRCAIRKLFGKKCFYLIPLLPLPKSLQNYLLLEPEGVLH